MSAILLLSCADQPGIVFQVAQYLFRSDLNIIDAEQYRDDVCSRFFMRVHFARANGDQVDLNDFSQGFVPLANQIACEWSVHEASQKTRTLLMVSKAGHCLNDLLYRAQSGVLPIEIVGVVSNHSDLLPLVRPHGIPYYHCPAAGGPPSQKMLHENQVHEIISKNNIELIVLARYMQILSDDFCGRYIGRIINIHHSFLPGFKGAKPYFQAHERGVKIIGATAHYVTHDLDEGPIIEQDVVRVGHGMTPQDLSNYGQDVEARVLARAVQWYAERRILLNGRRTVIFQA